MLSFLSIRRNRVITFLCFSSYYYDFFVIFCSLKPADYAGMVSSSDCYVESHP